MGKPNHIRLLFQLTDLLFFISILIVFILAYGVVAQALRYPNSKADWVLLKDVVYMPYWQMYGELFLEDLEGTGMSNFALQATIYAFITRYGLLVCAYYISTRAGVLKRCVTITL